VGECLTGKDIFLNPGTRVSYNGIKGSVECGVVIHCWFEEEISGYDCYVAFFGQKWPENKPDDVYVLRYAAISLEVMGSQ